MGTTVLGGDPAQAIPIFSNGDQPGVDWVTLDNGTLCTVDELWRRIERSLLNFQLEGRKRAMRKRGRKPRGPGSMLGVTAKSIQAAYRALDAARLPGEDPPRLEDLCKKVGASKPVVRRVLRAGGVMTWPPV